MSTGGITGTLTVDTVDESITIAEIVAVLNARLKRAETSTTLINEIKAALTYISRDGKWKALRTSSTTSLVAGSKSFVKPTNLRIEDKIVLNDGTVDYDPLEKSDFDYILKRRAGSPGNSQPLYYCPMGANIELDAACDKAYTATTYYWIWHPYQETILFGSPFREAIYNAVMFKYLEGKPEPERSSAYRNICDNELDKLRETEEDQLPVMARYKDI